jgi:diguanylate cyclase (GGDEF)-like protein/PAS domain S-box-containing protein
MKLDDSLFKEIIDSLFDGVYYVDLDRTILYWNKGAERLTGYSSLEMVGTNCWDNLLMHVDCKGVGLCQNGCPLHKSIQSGSQSEEDVYLHHKDGHRVPVRVQVTPVRDSQGSIIGAIEAFRDNSEKINALEMIEELQRKVFIDPLTGLANRRYVDIGLSTRFEEIIRYGWQFGVIMMDIDRFKSVNDRYGHDVGDKVLQVVAKTLLNSSRSSDTVGRWGGEEFVAVLSNITALRLRTCAERYRMLVERSSLPTETGPIRLTISAGVTLAIPGDTPVTIIKRADVLMYESKANGRNLVTSN